VEPNNLRRRVVNWWLVLGGAVGCAVVSPLIHKRNRERLWLMWGRAVHRDWRRVKRDRQRSGWSQSTWQQESRRQRPTRTVTRGGLGVKQAPINPASAPAATVGVHGLRNKTRLHAKCDLKCRQSVKPVSECVCSCGGRDHGKYVPGSKANIMATRLTPAQQKVQRAQMNRARQDQWKRKQAQRVAKTKTPARGGKAS
jgi:hypothetical protein